MPQEKLSQNKYYPRLADKLIEKKLTYVGAVEIRGPKWCGKTQSALQLAESSLMMQDPDKRSDYKLLADAKPSLLLEGARPRLIDEWQEAPQLWDAVRFTIDGNPEPGQFLLTGSSTPGLLPSHSGAGRIASLDMEPMTLSESRDSTCEVTLEQLFDGAQDISGHSDCDVEEMAYLICRGGWPRSVTSMPRDVALEMPFDYLTTIAEQDISRVDGVSRNPQYARLIMREYARLSSSQATQSTILKDLKKRDIDLSKDTVNGYLAALRRLYVIQELSSWTPSLHAKSRITKTPTRHFVCPSLAVAAIGASPRSLLMDISTMGLLFESLCVRDLRAYARRLGGELFHYHDESGLEADAVIQLRDGRYALLEVKLGASEVDDGAASLKALAKKIDKTVMGDPVFCAVVTPGGFAFRRSDGIFVLPISCLTADGNFAEKCRHGQGLP